jgi:hypothetical protein
MAEYIGFKAPESIIDYSELTGGLVDALKGVEQRRDEKRTQMEGMTSDLTSSINEYQGGKSKSMNDIMLEGAMKIKENIYNANKALKSGNLSPVEYRSIINNTNDYWSTLTSTAKNFDSRYQEIIARQESGEASKVEADLAEYYANIADLKNSVIHHDPSTGQIYYAKTDENGNVSRLDDVRRMNNPGNTLFNKVDLVTIADEVTKNVQDWSKWTDLGRGGSETVSDPRQNPAYKSWLQNTATGILSNDRAATSVLADNGVALEDGTLVSFDVYFDDGKSGASNMQSKVDDAMRQYQLLFPDATQEEVDKFKSIQEKSMIKMVQDESGDWQPSLTDEQRKLAYSRVVEEIEMRLPFEKKGTAQESYNSYYGVSSSGGGGGDNEPTGQGMLYPKLRAAWNLASGLDVTGKNKVSANQKASAATLTALSTKGYVYEWREGGLYILKPAGIQTNPITGQQEQRVKEEITGPIKNLESLAGDFYGESGAKGVSEAVARFNEERNSWSSKSGSNSNSTQAP